MAEVRVRGFERDDAARWEAFVHACPEATFFHRIGWPRWSEHACYRGIWARRDVKSLG